MIHVVEVRFRVGGEESLDPRMSNLITLVHRAAQGRKFAVGLPGYRNDAQPALGKCLQIFSFFITYVPIWRKKMISIAQSYVF